jgi:hypothetical protein
MEWLEQNIDAYRIVSEILGELRLAVRQRLEQIHGEEWYKKGLPEGVFKRLIASKEREKSIDWYEGQYQEIMDYAVFADLLEILEHSPDLFPSFTSLAPSTALLNARFLELDVMRAKLGRARPISETELSFLGTFHLRFRKAAQEAKEETFDVPPPSDQPEEEVAAAKPEEEVVSKPAPEPEPEPAVEDEPAPAASARPKRAVQTDVDTAATTETARDRSEERVKASSSVEDDIPTNVLRDDAAEAEEIEDEPAPQAKGPVDEISKTGRVVERGDAGASGLGTGHLERLVRTQLLPPRSAAAVSLLRGHRQGRQEGPRRSRAQRAAGISEGNQLREDVAFTAGHVSGQQHLTDSDSRPTPQFHHQGTKDTKRILCFQIV